MDAVLASEEHQYIAIDRRTADGASLEIEWGVEYLPKRRHAQLAMRKAKPPSGIQSLDGFAMLGPDGATSGGITLSLSRDAATKLAR
ncbi:MAG: hypothetical protein P4M05_13010 [Bradyrhizobium sp.]|nr:hypothetical protein [Bradyrhizobium sp.]